MKVVHRNIIDFRKLEDYFFKLFEGFYDNVLCVLPTTVVVSLLLETPLKNYLKLTSFLVKLAVESFLSDCQTNHQSFSNNFLEEYHFNICYVQQKPLNVF